MSIESEQQLHRETFTPETLQLLLAEHNALRSEMLKRIELQHQLLSLAVIAPGTLFAFGFQNKNAALILLYPILAMFLAAAWAASDRRVRQMGRYIKNRIEARIGENHIGWEHYSASVPIGRFGSLSFLASRGCFLGTQALAIIVGVSLAQLNATSVLLLVIAVISILCTGVVLRRAPVREVAPPAIPNSQEIKQLIKNETAESQEKTSETSRRGRRSSRQ